MPEWRLTTSANRPLSPRCVILCTSSLSVIFVYGSILMTRMPADYYSMVTNFLMYIHTWLVFSIPVCGPANGSTPHRQSRGLRERRTARQAGNTASMGSRFGILSSSFPRRSGTAFASRADNHGGHPPSTAGSCWSVVLGCRRSSRGVSAVPPEWL